MTQHPLIIIGTGLAGYQLARELRKCDVTSALTLITQDDGVFYPKPMLSTALTRCKTAKQLMTATAATLAQQLQATILTHTTVTAIDIHAKKIFMGTESLSYSKLIFASGARVIPAPVAGNAVTDILTINHLAHYARFQDAIQNKRHITILGAGLIGCEFANDLGNAGYTVHVMAPATAPLNLLIPERIGKHLQRALEKIGVHFHLPQTVREMNKSHNGYLLTLADNSTLTTDIVLSAIGLTPDTHLAKIAGLATQRGILVNRYLETSQPDVYALGDCAEVEGHVLPYITPLLNGSTALAKTLCGERTAVIYPAMPVTVKTPACPLVICPPPIGLVGEWQIESINDSIRALFYSETQQLRGFILTQAAINERATWLKQLPPLF